MRELRVASKPLHDPRSGYCPDFIVCYMSPCSVFCTSTGSLCYASNLLGTLPDSGLLHLLFSLIEEHFFQILLGLLLTAFHFCSNELPLPESFPWSPYIRFQPTFSGLLFCKTPGSGIHIIAPMNHDLWAELSKEQLEELNAVACLSLCLLLLCSSS